MGFHDGIYTMIYGIYGRIYDLWGSMGFHTVFFFVMGVEATYVTVDNGRLMIPTDFGSNKLT